MGDDCTQQQTTAVTMSSPTADSASTNASTSASASSSPNGSSPPASPSSSTTSLPSNSGSSYDPNEPFVAPLGADLDRDPSIDGTSIGAGSALGGSSDLGENGLRKTKLEDIDQEERAEAIRIKSEAN